MTVKELQDRLNDLNFLGVMNNKTVKFLVFNGFTEETETYYPESVDYGEKGDDCWVELW